LHRCGDFSGLRLQRRSLSRNDDLLAGLAYFESDIRADVVVARQIDAGTGECLEPADGNADFIRAYLQAGNYIVAAAGTDRLRTNSRGFICRNNHRVRYDSA